MIDPRLTEAKRFLDDAQFARAVEEINALDLEGQLGGSLEFVASAMAAYSSLGSDRPFEALSWLDRARDAAETAAHIAECDLLEAAALVATGDVDGAEGLLADLEVPPSTVVTYPQDLPAQLRVRVHAERAAWVEAFDVIETSLPAAPSPAMFSLLAQLPESVAEQRLTLLGALADEDRLPALHGLLDGPPSLVEQVADRWWLDRPGCSYAATAISIVGAQLPVETAAAWSARLGVGANAEHCPLLGIAVASERSISDRLDALAVSLRLATDPRAAPVVQGLAADIADDDLPEVLAACIRTDVDELVDEFIAAAATTPTRALILASELHARGVVGTTPALLRHAVALGVEDPGSLAVAVRRVGGRTGLDALVAAMNERDLAPTVQALRDVA